MLLAVQEPLGSPLAEWGPRIAFWAFRPSGGRVASPDMAGGPDPRTVGERLAVAIAACRLKDREVAERAGVGTKWLASVKRGDTKVPAADKLKAPWQM